MALGLSAYNTPNAETVVGLLAVADRSPRGPDRNTHPVNLCEPG